MRSELLVNDEQPVRSTGDLFGVGSCPKLYDAMPWRCPACHIAILHSEVELRPRPNALYRCHVCRLELMLDESGERLTVAPFDDDTPRPSTPRPRRP